MIEEVTKIRYLLIGLILVIILNTYYNRVNLDEIKKLQPVKSDDKTYYITIPK